jgi:hypothetical protein
MGNERIATTDPKVQTAPEGDLCQIQPRLIGHTSHGPGRHATGHRSTHPLDINSVRDEGGKVNIGLPPSSPPPLPSALSANIS